MGRYCYKHDFLNAVFITYILSNYISSNNGWPLYEARTLVVNKCTGLPYMAKYFFKYLLHIFLVGFAKRVKKDIGSVDVKVAEEPQSHSWVGGAVFAGMFHEHQFLEDMITTKQEYDEFGPRIVHSKCL